MTDEKQRSKKREQKGMIRGRGHRNRSNLVMIAVTVILAALVLLVSSDDPRAN